MTNSKSTTAQRIFLFHGEDDYTTARTVRRWIEAFIQKHSREGVEILDCLAEPERLSDALSALAGSASLFSSSRLLVLKHCSELSAEQHEPVLDYFDRIPEDAYLLIWETGAVKKNLKFYKSIAAAAEKGRARITTAIIPSGPALVRFLIDHAASHGRTLLPEAAERLAIRLGRDLAVKVKTSTGYEERQAYTLWEAASELDKLCAYTSTGTITADNVSALVTPKVSDDLFALSEAIVSGDSRRALHLLNQLLMEQNLTSTEQKAQAIGIVGALAGQARALLAARAALDKGIPEHRLADETGLHPYRLKKILPHVRRLPLSRIRVLILSLADIDRSLKSTTLPAGTLLSRFIMQAA